MVSTKLPRPMEVLTALRRLGYIDKPGKGDHVRLFKLLDHPAGPVTLQTGVDGDHCGHTDVRRIRRETQLDDDGRWAKALSKKLGRADYDEHLRSLPRSALVLDWWKPVVEQADAATATQRPSGGPAPKAGRRARGSGTQ